MREFVDRPQILPLVLLRKRTLWRCLRFSYKWWWNFKISWYKIVFLYFFSFKTAFMTKRGSDEFFNRIINWLQRKIRMWLIILCLYSPMEPQSPKHTEGCQKLHKGLAEEKKYPKWKIGSERLMNWNETRCQQIIEPLICNGPAR